MGECFSDDVAIVVLAAGASSRMGGTESKVFRAWDGESVLGRSLRVASECRGIGRLVVVCRETDRATIEAQVSELELHGTRRHVILGGQRRQDSVQNALEFLHDSGEVSWVLIHDAARPFASVDLYSRIAQATRESGAAVPGIPVSDTLRRRHDTDGWEIVDREELYAIQTPQGFSLSLLRSAHAAHGTEEVTDDGMLMEKAGHRLTMVAGEPRNLKITRPEDLPLLEAISRTSESRSMTYRVGFGTDSHRLEPGGPLRLGGVDVPSEHQSVGHSDADALLHAVIDGLLGALALGDIGQHFSDRDPAHRGRDSATMLAEVLDKVDASGYRPAQLDSVIHLEKTKVAPVRELIRGRLAELLGLDETRVSVKAKTAEGLGDIGAGRAISCEAMVVVDRKKHF